MERKADQGDAAALQPISQRSIKEAINNLDVVGAVYRNPSASLVEARHRAPAFHVGPSRGERQDSDYPEQYA